MLLLDHLIYNKNMHIKVLSFNIHKGIGWRRGHSTLALLHEQIHLLNPDLIFFQEIRGRQAESFIQVSRPHHAYGQNVVHSQGHYGNAIVTRFPILYSENFNLTSHRFEKRGLLHTIVKLPNDRQLHLLCVHLGLFRIGRIKQLDIIVNHIVKNIPENEPIILGGDFNDWSSSATTPLIKELALHEAFLAVQGSYAKTFPAWSPLLKLDRIYCRGFHVISAERKNDKSWRKLSDHLAIDAHLKLKL